MRGRMLLGLVTSIGLSCSTNGHSIRRDPSSADVVVPLADARSEAGNDCVQACLGARQMEARAISAIEADCRKACQANPTAYPMRERDR